MTSLGFIHLSLKRIIPRSQHTPLFRQGLLCAQNSPFFSLKNRAAARRLPRPALRRRRPRPRARRAPRAQPPSSLCKGLGKAKAAGAKAPAPSTACRGRPRQRAGDAALSSSGISTPKAVFGAGAEPPVRAAPPRPPHPSVGLGGTGLETALGGGSLEAGAFRARSLPSTPAPSPPAPAASRRCPGAEAARCAASWGARNGGPRGAHMLPPLSERLSRP